MTAYAGSRPPTFDELIRRYGRWFWFGSARMRDHTALTALRIDRYAPGLTCVITPDLGELADALEQDLQGSRPGLLPPEAGPGHPGTRPG